MLELREKLASTKQNLIIIQLRNRHSILAEGNRIFYADATDIRKLVEDCSLNPL